MGAFDELAGATSTREEDKEGTKKPAISKNKIRRGTVTSEDYGDDAKTEMNMIPEEDDEENSRNDGVHNVFRDGPAPAPAFQKRTEDEVFDDKTMYSENIFVNDASSKKKDAAFNFNLPKN